MFAISESGRASSSYTDYDAFVMLDHVHFILYTLLEDSHKLYLDLNIDDFQQTMQETDSVLQLAGACWVFCSMYS